MAIKRTYTFPIGIYCGDGDIGEAEITCRLTEEEAQRLAAAAPGFHMDEVPELQDIYLKIYDKADKKLTKELWEDDPENAEEMAEEWAEENEESPRKWTISEAWPLIINFPEELQNDSNE